MYVTSVSPIGASCRRKNLHMIYGHVWMCYDYKLPTFVVLDWARWGDIRLLKHWVVIKDTCLQYLYCNVLFPYNSMCWSLVDSISLKMDLRQYLWKLIYIGCKFMMLYNCYGSILKWFHPNCRSIYQIFFHELQPFRCHMIDPSDSGRQWSSWNLLSGINNWLPAVNISDLYKVLLKLVFHQWSINLLKTSEFFFEMFFFNHECVQINWRYPFFIKQLWNNRYLISILDADDLML